MANRARSGESAARGVGLVLLAIVAINVLPRLVGLPDVDLPSISAPDLPAWADGGVDVIHTVLRVKNWLLVAVVAVLIVGVAVDQRSKRRER